MRMRFVCLLLAAVVVMSPLARARAQSPELAKLRGETAAQRDQRMRWWREARFGLFIHWGVYSILADGEWVMNNKQIPVTQYELLPTFFNPTPLFHLDDTATPICEAVRKMDILDYARLKTFTKFIGRRFPYCGINITVVQHVDT